MLNETELLVLNTALDIIISETGGQFGFSSDVKVASMSHNKVAGYLSQLSQKGLLRIWKDGMIMATAAGQEAAGRTAEWFEVD